MPADLKTQWLFLCSRLFWRSRQQHPAEWGVLYDDLIARYNEPHRVYHGVNHLQECFDTLVRVPEHHLPAERETVELALFAHDAVYDLRGAFNELESAHYAERLVHTLGGPLRTAQDVWFAVMDTTHTTRATNPAGAIVCDIDLAHFGMDWDAFVAKRELVTREYAPLAAGAGMDAHAFAQARADALEPFVARESIYQTCWFQERYERQAQQNLARHIAELEKNA